MPRQDGLAFAAPARSARALRSASLGLVALLLLGAVPAPASGPAEPLVAPALLDGWARQAALAAFPELVELLAIPNDEQVPEDIRKNAAWLEKAFARRGFAARQLPNDGRPMVFAELEGGRPGRKTVLLYLHLDGQGVTPSEWSQESPWKAVLKRRGASGGWEPVPQAALSAGSLEPEWRLFARSSSDDKGPILMLLAAVDALRSHGLTPAVNVKVLLDSQEEKGSPSVPRVVAENRSALAADGVVVLDGPRHESNRPTLAFGNRGVVKATLRVFGPRGELHSGHYGNYAPNPAQRLASLLASMKDDSGRVTVAGFADGVVLDDSVREILASVPDDEAALKRRLGIAAPASVGASYQESLQLPSLNVRGLSSADVGEKARTVVPESAVAEIDIRTVPETPPERLAALLERHVESQGYHLVKGAPTDEERATHPKLASLTFGDLKAQGVAARTDPRAPIGRWATGALRKTFGADPIRIRTMGGTVPTRALVDPLGAPFVILPLVNPDNAQHAADENLRIGNYVDGVRALVGLLLEPF